MRLPDGPQAGEPWAPESEPLQRLFLLEIDSGRWRIFIFIAPSQRGKTLAGILCPTMHAIAERRQSVGYVMPTTEKLQQTWEGKIRPAIAGSGFGDWLPVTGPGSRGGKSPAITMRDPSTGLVAGRIYFMALPKGRETSVSSVSPAVIVLDEADDAEDAGQYQLVYRRLESWGREGRGFVVSTLNEQHGRRGHPVLTAHAEGSRARLWHKCSHCHKHAPLEWEHIDQESARVRCPSCHVLWNERDRRDALIAALLVHHGQSVEGGVVVGEPTPTDPPGVCSLWSWGLDYIRADVPMIVAEYRAAKRVEAEDPGPMRLFHLKVLCRDYKPIDDARLENNAQALASLSAASSHQRGLVPEDIDCLTFAVDCQLRQHYWMAVAHRGQEHWLVDWGAESLCAQGIDPTPEDRARLMDRLRDLAREKWGVAAAICGVDLGGGGGKGGPDWGSTLHDWLRENTETWIGLRGVGEYTAVRISDQMRQQWFEIGESGILLANADPLKAYAAQALRRPTGTPTIHLPSGLAADDWLLRSLTAERREDTERGPVWVVLHRRNDWWDCLIYNLALARHRAGIPQAASIDLPLMHLGGLRL